MEAAMGGLLEWLACETEVSYLSDLRQEYRTPARTADLRAVLARCPAVSWPADDWAQAVRYLTGGSFTPATGAEAVAFLLSSL